MKYLLLFILCSLLLLSALSTAIASSAAQDSILFRPDVERMFVAAMSLFRAGKYDSAATMFVRTAKDFSHSHRSTGAYIMGGKAYYRSGNYRESIKLLKDLLDLYAESRYADDAHYTLGLNYYRMGRYEDAATEFQTARQGSRDPQIISRSDRMLETLTSTNLSIAELQLLLQDATVDELKALINLRIAEKIYKTGDTKAAMDVLRGIVNLAPQIKYVGDALSLLDRIEKGGVIKIGVVLPLLLKAENASAREVGIQFLEGIQEALDEYNQDAVIKVNIDIRDTERDPSIAARQVTELCNDERTVAIVGPISSNEVFASAGIANARGVPQITPTGTSNGIAGIGPYVFQANPDYDVRGRSMAYYAVMTLKARTVATLAPLDAVGKLMADSFLDEAKKLGADVIDAEWYQAGSTDIRTQIAALRLKALGKKEFPYVDFTGNFRHDDVQKMVLWGVNERSLDSLVERGALVRVDSLLGADWKKAVDSLNIPTRIIKMKYDSLGLPVDNIDALFVPLASSDEIPVVSSQLKFYNIQSQILGTGDWNDLAELDQNRQYVDGIMFSTDSWVEPADKAYKLFVLKFQKTNKGRKPDVNTLFGYDVMKLLLQTVGKGAVHRNEIAAAIPKVQDFAGLHSKISFTDSRVNSYLIILQYKNRSIRKIGDVDLSHRPTIPPAPGP
ncbi:MAG: ABC transporter substrate-binding protein [Bacteroidota bacterium]